MTLTFPLDEDAFSAAVREIAEDVAPKIIRDTRAPYASDDDYRTLLNQVTNAIRARGATMVEEAEPMSRRIVILPPTDEERRERANNISRLLRRSSPTRIPLADAGIRTIDGDLTSHSEADLMALPGIGPSRLQEIKEALRSRGLALRADAVDPDPEWVERIKRQAEERRLQREEFEREAEKRVAERLPHVKISAGQRRKYRPRRRAA